MYILKKIFKDKNKPFFGKVANAEFEEMFSTNQAYHEKAKNNLILGIIQEISDGESTVVSGVYLDNSFQHIEKDGKIYKFKTTEESLLKAKNQIFDLVVENIEQIKQFDRYDEPFLRDKGIRISFLTPGGIFNYSGQYADFNKGKVLPHILTFFLNTVLSINRK